ncbi:hypothetical protein GS597_14490 [Synechococcales cyanobacterium C]|uniref:Uncharacterized protein n=1 Tax=Petrachloros mirabilis ULC683 TaxID=2781853 RepID=A0A8K2A0V4_9CYAN|nr:hypothetical protein [Petrachloros mirabilis]NCJ07696.1 hypothetical protein [Petrachloros mirabilis ULC683]
MYSLCEDANQKDLMRFWISELTGYPPQKVETVVETLSQRRVLPNQPIFS